MLVQDYIRKNGLQALVDTYKIVPTQHPELPLVILNYDMIASPKGDPIVQECRALTLEEGSWNVVARSFHRFFNYGEMLELTDKFNWNQFEASSKEDGSLMVMYHYDGEWRVNTRGSFAKGTICEGGPTWEDTFWKIINKDEVDGYLKKEFSYVFELCTMFNKIVRAYPEPTAYLTGMFHNESGYDYESRVITETAHIMGWKTPDFYTFNNADEVVGYLSNSELDATFEGFVLRDPNGLRLKVKNARYVALHHLKGNGNLFLSKNLLPLILAGDDEETLVYFPEAKERFKMFKEIVDAEKAKLMDVWEWAKDIASQKEFAQFIVPKTRLASILFDARKQGVHPETVWKTASDRILNILPRSS